MRILFCVPAPITSKLGRPKVYVELARALEDIGCECKLVGSNDVIRENDDLSRDEKRRRYQKGLKRYINANASDFDVVEYEHPNLPFPRSEITNEVALVSRSVLLIHHSKNIRLPVWEGIAPIVKNFLVYLRSKKKSELSIRDYGGALKKHIGTALRYEWDSNRRKERAIHAEIGMHASDLVVVSNRHDVEELIRAGVDEEKILRLPFGLSEVRRKALMRAQSGNTNRPVITFVGTFDFRKGGATDIPKIVKEVASDHPKTHFRLLGTSGLFVDRKQALVHFPVEMHSRIEIIPRYEPEQLPDLLSGSSIGIFPSRYEGFPFGVLEMLAAGLPVFAYDAPGPPEMLPEKWLSPIGDWKTIANKINRVLRYKENLSEIQSKARSLTNSFSWKRIAVQTKREYSKITKQ